MKTIPPQCPEPETVKYFRSIESLENSPEAREWLEREFPAGASENEGGFNRRDFMKLMSASMALAGAGILGSGCRKPEQHIYPFAKLPDDYVHGVSKFYATAFPTRSGAIPLLVKSHEGRPTKVEGNPEHPDSNGGTDVFAQASILSLYDPDRAQLNSSREAALTKLGEIATKFSANQGAGLAFLLERGTSPSRNRVQQAIQQKFSASKFYAYEAVDFDIHRQAASAAVGRSVTPYFKYDQAKVILSLDCDFLGGDGESHLNSRDFSKSRRASKEGMNRLYVAEALMSQTGMNADHRLRVASSHVIAIAAAIAAKLVTGFDASKFPLPTNVNPKWVEECANDLQANGAASLVVAGYRQPLAVHLLAHAINSALGSLGKTVEFRETPDLKEQGITQLAESLNKGEVDTLVILGGNPVYNAPADLNWATTQRKAKTIVRLGYYEDETTAAANAVTDINLPAAHYLESWGDVKTADGTTVIVQPLIQPLFGGLTELEVLARIGGLAETDPYKITRETSGLNDEAWKKALHDGFVVGTASKPAAVSYNASALVPALANITLTTPTKENLEVVFARDYSVDDGRWANNGWLVEVPDPVTKMTWDNAVLVSRRTAEELGVKNAQFIDLSLVGRTVRAPVWIVPGMANYTLGLPLGFGRAKGGRIANFNGKQVGFNFYPLRGAVNQGFAVGAKVSAAAEQYSFACTQDHWSLEGRPIIREITPKQVGDPKAVAAMDFPPPPGGNQSLYPNPFDAIKSKGLHQWGMAIDLNTCVGCNACVIACQSENNVPVVGKDQVRRGREMLWLRIDRYFTGTPEAEKIRAEKNEVLQPDWDQYKQTWIDDPQVVTQPMMCQHCEAAPCESVCPVNATVHDEEGLNLMVYNRCVGTRYCSNNCPWKVRRFNYFDYTKRPITNLYKPTLTFKPTKPEDEFELLKLARNPDVSVRMRGVMEKCTFCVQRIEGAKIAQKVKAGQSADVIVRDGTIQTACQQACPAESITFGDINDPKSAVSLAKADARNYTTLEFLHTKPRLTYLARVRNQNEKMPDYHPMPFTSQVYSDHSGGHDSGGGHGGGTNAAAHKEGAKH
jgi:MoCo/4Fe-4S cofactor protein with predicted Tat translocation signal